MAGGTAEVLSFVPFRTEDFFFSLQHFFAKRRANMKEQLEQIKAKALADLAAAADMPALDAVRVRVLGKRAS